MDGTVSCFLANVFAMLFLTILLIWGIIVPVLAIIAVAEAAAAIGAAAVVEAAAAGAVIETGSCSYWSSSRWR